MMFRDRRRVRAVLMSAVAALVVVGAAAGTTTPPHPRPRRPRARMALPLRRTHLRAPRPPPTASTDVEPVTITYLASQNWVLDSERELAEQFEAGDRDPRRLPDHPCRPVLQRAADEARSGWRGHRHLRWAERQDRHPAPARGRGERRSRHRRGVGAAHGSLVDRADQPRRRRVRPDDLGHGRRFVGRRVQQDDLRRQRHRGADHLRRVRRRLPDAFERRGHTDLRAGLGRMASRAVVP